MTPFKLYYTPTSCGAANFLAATIGVLTFNSEVVDLPTHKTKSGADFYKINPKGNVPTIVFPNGSILNENVATLTYLADAGNAHLAPKEGTPERIADRERHDGHAEPLSRSCGASRPRCCEAPRRARFALSLRTPEV